MQKPKMLSIIIPAYNEEKRIVPTLTQYLNFYKKNTEFIVVNDGSTDNTEKIINKFKAKYRNLRLINQKNQGKGAAVITGMKLAKGDFIAFVDADNSIIPPEFEKTLKHIKNYDVAISSRHIKGAYRRQRVLEKILGRGLNLFVRFLLGLNIYDTQCGAKIFRKEVLKKILMKIEPDRWSFDISLLYYAKRSGFSIKESPIKWNPCEGTKFNFKKEIPGFLKTIFKLRFSI